MRILCVTGHNDRPEAETIIGLKRLGIEISVLCPDSAPHYRRMIDAGIAVSHLKLKSRVDPNGINAIRRHILDAKIDILHLFNNRAVSNGILASIKLPVKIIAYRGTVGNVSFFDPGSWMTYLHPRVDRIICVSEAVRRFFLEMRCLWLRVPPAKPVTVYKGHDLAWYQEKPCRLSTLGIPDGAFVVGCTGRYRPHKGLHILVEAMRHLPERLPIHLLLIGDMEAPAFRKQIERSPAAPRIHLAGYRKDAPALQSACQAAILPALRREGLPKVIIEAMAYGVPPIVTDSGGSPELIEDGISGIVVPPGDPEAIAQAIIRLYENPEARKVMGQQARAHIGRCFRIEDTVRRTADVYRDISGTTERIGSGTGKDSEMR
jgi:glycosyltransferase involved in cell wall biosynthesis